MRWLKWIAVPLVLAALLIYGLYYCVFCSDHSAGAGPQGQREIVLRLPTWPMETLDPVIWKPELVLIQGTICEGLFGYDKDLNVVPKIAKSWEVSPDKLTWTIHMRTDKRWSNGDPVTAQDFIYAWTRFCSPEVPSETWASMFPSVVHAIDYKANSVPRDSLGFRAPDDSTLVIHLMRPKALTSFLAMGSSMPLHRASYAAAQSSGHGDDWWMPGYFVGNGPYLPKSFVRDGEVVLEKNPHYVGPCGNVDRFVLKAMDMSTQNVQIQQYEAGELDLAQVLTLGDYAYATKAAHLKLQVHRTPELGFLGLQMARTVNKLMNDPDLRRAIALALDRSDIADNVMGGRVVPTEVFGPPTDTLFNGIKTHGRDVAEAKKYLAKSAYKGETIYLFTPPATDVEGLAAVSEAVQAQLKAIGLHVVIENLEQDLLTGTLASYVWGGGYLPDPEYTRPGLTLFPGKVLWKEPVLLMRGTDAIWYWMNFTYAVKEMRKAVTLERLNIKNEDYGANPKDWDALKPLRDSAEGWYRRIRTEEPDTVLRNKIADHDPGAEFDRVRASVTATTPKAEAISKWQGAKDRLLDAKFNMYTDLLNGPNLEGNRILAHLETKTMSDSEVVPMLRRLIQIGLDEDWIIPLVSETLTYLKRPFVHGEELYKFGVWNTFFNLQYMNVDTAAYWKARS